MSPVKVHFRLVQDEDGYPSAAVESLWAAPVAEPNEYVVDNIPFFARDATIGDTIRIREESEHWWFERIVRPSRNSLIRVVFFDRTCVEKIGERLVSLGCSIEYSKDINLMAINIPINVALIDVQSYLKAEASKGSIDFEEPILRQ